MAVTLVKRFQTSDGQQFESLRLAEKEQIRINADNLIEFKDKTYDDYINKWTDPKSITKFPEFRNLITQLVSGRVVGDDVQPIMVKLFSKYNRELNSALNDLSHEDREDYEESFPERR